MLIKFLPTERTVEAREEESLLSIAQRAGLTSVECCGMNPLCGKCKLSVLEGEEMISKMRVKEIEYAKENGLLPYQRLGCLARLLEGNETTLCVELEVFVKPIGEEVWQPEKLES